MDRCRRRRWDQVEVPKKMMGAEVGEENGAQFEVSKRKEERDEV